MGSLDFHDEKIIIKLPLEFTKTSPVSNPHCQSIWNQKNIEIYSHFEGNQELVGVSVGSVQNKQQIYEIKLNLNLPFTG